MSDQTHLDPNAAGPGVVYRSSPQPTQEQAQQVVDAIRDKIEAGETDPAELQRRLSARFGADAGDIVDEQGAIDYGKLEKVITAFRAEVEDRVRSHLGGSVHAIQDEPPLPERPEVPDVPEPASVIPEPPKTPELHGIRQFVDKILDELVGDDLDSGAVVNLKT